MSEWINVQDRLPLNKKPVLVAQTYGSNWLVRIGNFRPEVGWDLQDWEGTIEVKYWIEIPEIKAEVDRSS